MLTRICLILALIAGIAVAALNFTQVEKKITDLIADRNSERSQKEQAQTELAQTKNDLDKTTAQLTETKAELATAQTERDSAVNKANEQSARADALSKKLDDTTAQRDDAQAKLAAYEGTGYKPEQIITFGKQIKDAQEALDASKEENKILLSQNDKLKYRIAVLIGEDQPVVELPANLKGTILVADPKWDFVVLDVGEDQGAKQDGLLLVSRNGKLVAKLRITTVEKSRCIANVMPGWKLGDLMEGDVVIPAIRS